MRIDHDQISMIRAELSLMVGKVSDHIARGTPLDAIDDVDAIRRKAAGYGFGAAEHIAGALESSLAGIGGSASAKCYLEALVDAIGCKPVIENVGIRANARASEALLASVALRTHG